MRTATMLHPGFIDLSSLDLSGLDGSEKSALIATDDPNVLSDFERSHLGKITCSNFGRVTYRKNSNEWSDGALTFLYELISEHDTGQPSKRFSGSAATEFGKDYEEEAINYYEQVTGRRVFRRQEMLKLPDSLLIGGTPDALFDNDNPTSPTDIIGWGIEVKCPFNPANHYRTIETGAVPKEYIPQVNGHMLLSGFNACDFISYNPRATRKETKIKIITVPRIDSEIADLRTRLLHFEQTLLERLEALGIEPRV